LVDELKGSKFKVQSSRLANRELQTANHLPPRHQVAQREIVIRYTLLVIGGGLLIADTC
jgi:hypothetical protein